MKVNKRKVITKILSCMLVMALIIGLMPGIGVKAEGLVGKLTIGDEFNTGEVISLTSSTYILCFENKTSTERNKKEELSSGKEYVVGRWGYTTRTFMVLIHKDDYNKGHYLAETLPNRKPIGVKVVSGSGTEADPFVFEVIYDTKDEEAFEAEKTAQKAEADALLKSDDSEACKKLVTDAKDAIDKAEYDYEKELEENKEALAAIVTKLKTDLDAQRESEKAASGSGSDGKEEETHPDGTKTVTEIKTENGKNTITVTDYDKGGQQTAQFIYEGTKGDTLELRTVNFGGKNLKVPDTVKGGGKTYKVTRLRKNFMKKCKKAKKLDVGKNVSQIDKGALNGGKKLETVIIRGKLKKVGRGAFKSMKKGTIKIKGSKKTFEKNKKLLEKSGINPNVKFKRVKNSKK